MSFAPAVSALRSSDNPGCSSLPGQLPPRSYPPLTLGTVAAFLFLASPLAAGGLEDEATTPDPCPPGLVIDDTLTGDMLAGFLAIREMSCGERPVRAFFDRATGERLTDEEITRRIFNGSTPIAPVPLPAGGVLLLGALVMLWRRV